MVEALPIARIVRRPDARRLNDATVSALADSIASIGLINPIRVRASNGGWEVSAGSHRLAASAKLGLADIDCIVVTEDDLHAELSMIDENLCRNELSPAERAQQTARRKELYLELHPETAQYVAGGKARQNAASENFSFAENTAKATNQSERIVQLNVERGTKVIPEVIDLISGTKLDTGSYLDKLKKLPPNEQVIAAKRDLAFLRTEVRDQAAKAKTSKIDADVKSRAAKEVAAMIAEHVPGEWLAAVKSNLYAAGAANIANELNNLTGESIMDRRFG